MGNNNESVSSGVVSENGIIPVLQVMSVLCPSMHMVTPIVVCHFTGFVHSGEGQTLARVYRFELKVRSLCQLGFRGNLVRGTVVWIF